MITERRGFTILELTVALGVFLLIMLAAHSALDQSITVWRNVSSRDEAVTQLRKARDGLLRDLSLAAFSELDAAPGPMTLGGIDGDALWFLSAVDPATGQFCFKPDGTPLWQRNIVYYAVIPDNVGALGFSGPGAVAGGYEVGCPYKVLVRKEIDAGAPTVPGDETTVETLITDIVPYVTDAPDGYDTSGMGGAGVQSVQLAAVRLLTFRAGVDEAIGEVTIDLRGVAIRDASKNLAVGSVPLDTGRFTSQLRFSVFPHNRQPVAP